MFGEWSKAVVRLSLVIFKLKENQKFFVVLGHHWQWRFEKAAVGVWLRQGVSSWKQPLCQGAASLISDLGELATMADRIDGQSLL